MKPKNIKVPFIKIVYMHQIGAESRNVKNPYLEKFFIAGKSHMKLEIIK